MRPTPPTDGLRPETSLAVAAVHEALALAVRGRDAADIALKAGRDVVTGAALSEVDGRPWTLASGSALALAHPT